MIDDAGEAVGYVWFTIEDRPVGRVVFIYDIAVDPEHRRKGHAQAALVGGRGLRPRATAASA